MCANSYIVSIFIAEAQPNFTATAVGTTGIASTSNFITLRSYIATTIIIFGNDISVGTKTSVIHIGQLFLIKLNPIEKHKESQLDL